MYKSTKERLTHVFYLPISCSYSLLIPPLPFHYHDVFVFYANEYFYIWNWVDIRWAAVGKSMQLRVYIWQDMSRLLKYRAKLNALRDQWSLCDHIQEIWSCKESVVPLLSMLIPWFCFDAIASTHVREFNICAHTYSSENFLVTSIRCSTVRLRKSEYALLLCDDIFFFFLSCSSFFSLPANKANERANCFISCIHSYASFMWLFI